MIVEIFFAYVERAFINRELNTGSVKVVFEYEFRLMTVLKFYVSFILLSNH